MTVSFVRENLPAHLAFGITLLVASNAMAYFFWRSPGETGYSVVIQIAAIFLVSLVLSVAAIFVVMAPKAYKQLQEDSRASLHALDTESDDALVEAREDLEWAKLSIRRALHALESALLRHQHSEKSLASIPPERLKGIRKVMSELEVRQASYEVAKTLFIYLHLTTLVGRGAEYELHQGFCRWLADKDWMVLDGDVSPGIQDLLKALEAY